MTAPEMGRANDERLMSLALALGRRSLGQTWPNPSVGAVLVRESERGPSIVAQGATQPGGRPHAERMALAAAGEAARGATLYVSLEPCSHHGRTPPCVDAITAAGVARVVSALEDPDPRVAGRGYAQLRGVGIEVVDGIGAQAAARDHRGHLIRVRDGRPALILKIARTADGFAAGVDASRLKITGEGADGRTHMLRVHSDAILVGISTVLVDDPRLDVRLPGLEPRSPLRIVLDSRLRLPGTAGLVVTARERPTVVVCTVEAPAEAERRLTAEGVEVIRAEPDDAGRVDLREALRALAGRGLTRILCEGGPRLAEALAASELVDDMVLMTSTRALGGPGQPALGRNSTRMLAENLRRIDDEVVGPDRIESFERKVVCSRAS